MNIKAEAVRYDGLTSVGLKSSDALAITEKISALSAPTGSPSVQTWQYYGAIVDMAGLSEENKIAAMSVYEAAGAGDKSKVQTAANYGVDMSNYADVAKLVSDYKLYADKDSLSKNELTDLLNSASYSTETKAVLWALNTTAKYGNPYGRIYNGTLDWVYGG